MKAWLGVAAGGFLVAAGGAALVFPPLAPVLVGDGEILSIL